MSAVVQPPAGWSRSDDIALLRIHHELERRERRRKLLTYFPDTGPLRRELYPRHMDFFAAGAQYRQRLMLAANRIGKTESVGLYELALHLTGQYPAWWRGRRFTRPIRAWAAGDTSETVRDILQRKLLGPIAELGTGVLPGDSLARYTRGGGVADAIDTIYVRHTSDPSGKSCSVLSFKSYDQRRKSFQGTEQDVILLDEEPPMDVYAECLLRTMTNDGMLMLTFTPLLGMSEVVLSFLPGGDYSAAAAAGGLAEGKFVILAGWDDAPHLTDAVKTELLASIPPFQRDARSKGIPQLGAGAIYPVPESDIIVPDFPIPEHWPRAYGLDVGWNRTAAVWGAWNITLPTPQLVLYAEYYRGQAEPSVHATAIKSRGDWIPGVIDPAARGRSSKDGAQLLHDYTELGLDLAAADNSVEAGLLRMWEGLSTGRIKVFESLGNWRTEYRLYRRDEKGAVVKKSDHLMDASRYLAMSGRARAVSRAELPLDDEEAMLLSAARGSYREGSGRWMG